MEEIQTYEIDFSDDIAIYIVNCPKCQDTIKVYRYSESPDPKCKCGYSWSLETKAIGKK